MVAHVLAENHNGLPKNRAACAEACFRAADWARSRGSGHAAVVLEDAAMEHLIGWAVGVAEGEEVKP